MNFGLACFILFVANFAQAQTSTELVKEPTIQVKFGPHAGIGTTSDETELRYSSGFRLLTNYMFYRNAGYQLGAGIGFSNSFSNARKEADGTVEIRDYDHRTFLIGMKAIKQTSLANWYLAVHGGPSNSKLTIDRSEASIFSQKSAGGVDGMYGDVEIGAQWPVQKDFVITTSILASNQTLNHDGLTYAGERETQDEDGNLSLTAISGSLIDDGLPKKLVVKSYAASIGVAVLL